MKLLLMYMVQFGWSGRTADFSAAFPHATLDKPVYVMEPLSVAADPRARRLWKLNRALYGLRIAPKKWHAHLSRVLQEEFNLKESISDPSIYYNADMIVYVHVDDLFVVAKEATATSVFEAVQRLMHLKLGPWIPKTPTIFVGKMIRYLADEQRIEMWHTPQYLDNIVEVLEFGGRCNPLTTVGFADVKPISTCSSPSS